MAAEKLHLNDYSFTETDQWDKFIEVQHSGKIAQAEEWVAARQKELRELRQCSANEWEGLWQVYLGSCSTDHGCEVVPDEPSKESGLMSDFFRRIRASICKYPFNDLFPKEREEIKTSALALIDERLASGLPFAPPLFFQVEYANQAEMLKDKLICAEEALAAAERCRERAKQTRTDDLATAGRFQRQIANLKNVRF